MKHIMIQLDNLQHFSYPIVSGEVITQGVTNISVSSVSLNGTLVSVGNHWIILKYLHIQ